MKLMKMNANQRKILAKLDEMQSLMTDIRKLLAEEPALVEEEIVAEEPGEAEGNADSGDGTISTGRKVCPKCGSLSFSKYEDKGKVIYYHQGAPIYAKKGVCNQCGQEFAI
ncbi:MAG: hypothetical protein ACTSUE_18980 [Promethearchaeota archaeon]